MASFDGNPVTSGRRGPAGLSLDEYLDHREHVGDRQVLWENNGWSLRGKAGGRDALLWTSPYFLTGPPGGAFRLDRAAVCQTMLVLVDDPERPLTDPNEFVAAGWEPDQFEPWTAWTVAQERDQVTWSRPGRRFSTAADHWAVSGDHAGVGIDVRLDPTRSALWLSPPEEALGDREDRWFVANAAVDGTVSWGGTDHRFEGHALHEKHVHLGTSYNPVSLLRGSGVTWHSGSTDGLAYSVLARPDLDRWWALLSVGDRTLSVRDPRAVRVEVTDEWTDPETLLHLPRAWKLSIAADDVYLELETTAHARAYYLWNFLRDGVTILYWWVTTSRGHVSSNGRRRALAAVPSEVHLNRTFYERRRGT